MTRTLVTDAPDPDCPQCKGKGVRGTCEERGHDERCHGVHTVYFCECVNERYEDE